MRYITLVLLVLSFVLVGCGDADDDNKFGDESSLEGERGGVTGTGESGGGELGCLALYQCVDACASDACYDQCFSRAYSDATAQLGAVVECAGTCDESEGCFEERCGPVADRCIADTRGLQEDSRPSPLTCRQLLDCAGDCSSDACVDSCIERSADASVQQAGALIDCGQRCDWEEGCLAARCHEQLQACR